MAGAWNLPCVLRENGSSLGEGRRRDSRQRKLCVRCGVMKEVV